VEQMIRRRRTRSSDRRFRPADHHRRLSPISSLHRVEGRIFSPMANTVVRRSPGPVLLGDPRPVLAALVWRKPCDPRRVASADLGGAGATTGARFCLRRPGLPHRLGRPAPRRRAMCFSPLGSEFPPRAKRGRAWYSDLQPSPATTELADPRGTQARPPLQSHPEGIIHSRGASAGGHRMLGHNH
jgi:hypothetical protein